MEAKQTPLIELLERVPQDARVVVEHDQFSSSSHPVGRLCHEAAAALRAALAQEQAEPVQEPVAWMFTDPDKPRVKFLEWQKETRGYSGVWIKTPLYTAPPQRQPLTEEEIYEMYNEPRSDAEMVDFARAVERAHGIGEAK